MSEHDKPAHEEYAEALPLLALGALDGQERDAVEAHARSCDQCSRELQRLNADLAMLALSTPPQPPTDRAKARLMTAIAREPRTTTHPVPRPGPRSRWWMVVPSAVALGLLALVIAMWKENTSMQREIESVKREALQGHANTERAAQIIRLLTERDSMHVTLVAANAKPQPTGRAIYSPRSGGLVFFASNFAAVPADKAYELWLIPQQGAPIPAGVFKPDTKGSGMIMMPSVPKDMQPKAFAITVEPESGSTTPTMPIVLQGASS
jgi:anti-sigma-K factor RskA